MRRTRLHFLVFADRSSLIRAALCSAPFAFLLLFPACSKNSFFTKIGDVGGAGSGTNSGSSSGSSTGTSSGAGPGVRAATAAHLALSSPAVAMGVQSVNSFTARTILVNNTGDNAATGLQAAFSNLQGFSYRGGTYPGLGGTCGSVIEGVGSPNSSCSIVVNFNPPTVNTYASTLSLRYVGGGLTGVSTTTLDLTGTGANVATLKISTSATDPDQNAYNLGTLANGAALNFPLYVHYAGAVPAIGVNIFIPPPFQLLSTTCATIVAGVCQINVRLTASNAGVFSGDFKLTYNNSSYVAEAKNHYDVTVSSLVTPAVLSVSNAAFNGLLSGGPLSTQLLTVTKTGTQAATLVVPRAFLNPRVSFTGGSYPGAGGNCGATITGNCSVYVSYDPSQAGAIADSFVFDYNNGSASAVSTGGAISGTVGYPAQLFAAPLPTGNFGAVSLNNSSVLTFSFTNTNSGATAATGITTPVLTAPFSITANTCAGATLAANSPCSVTVKFQPTANGAFSAPLTVNYWDGDSSASVSVTLTGTGSNNPTLSAASLNLGSVMVNATSAVKTVNVTYYGADAATGFSVSGMDSRFAFAGGSFPGTTGTCTNPLTASCTLAFVFAPAVSGVASLPVTLSYLSFVGGPVVNVPITLGGTGLDPAVISIAALPDGNFGSVSVNYTSSLTFNITNQTGTYRSPATVLSVPALVAPFWLVSTTCGASLAPAISCTATVKFSPTAQITSPSSLGVNYFDGSAAQSTSKLLSGTGTDVPTLTTTPTTLDLGSVLVGATSNGATLTLNYFGVSSATALTVTGIAAPFSYAGGSFPGTGGTCGASVSSSCTLTITFSPTAAGFVTQPIVISYLPTVGGMPISVNVSLKGIGKNPAVLAFTNALIPYDFGTVSVNDNTKTAVFSLTNTSPATNSTTANGVSLVALAGAYSILANACGATLAPGVSCNVTVRFLPTSSALDPGIILTANYNDGSGTPRSATRGITGQGTDSARLTATSFAAGNTVVGNTVIGTITVGYFGAVPATAISVTGMVSPAFDFVGSAYPGTGGTCGASISATCTLKVAFTPSAAGLVSQTGVLHYLPKVGGTPTSVNVALTGTGVNGALISVLTDTSPYDFGDLAYNVFVDKTLTLKNSGATGATALVLSGLSAPVSFKGGSYPGTGGTCSTTLAAAASCTVVLTYAPTAAFPSGPRTLSTSYSNGSTTASFPFVFNGVSHPVATIGVSTVAFSKVAVGTTSVIRSLTISNTGTGGVGQLIVSPVSPPFVLVANHCSASLALGMSCQVDYQFQPSAPGYTEATITVSFDDNGTPKKATGKTTGTGTVPPQIAANGEHTCKVSDVGQVRCWGHNNVGQLGQGDTLDRGVSPGQVAALPAIDLGPGRYVKKIAAGYWHNVALLDDGTVKCFGANTTGQLGIGSAAFTMGGAIGEMGASLSSVNLGTGRTAIDVVAGYAHSCAILDDRTVKCWGLNSQGQLGLGDIRNRGALAADMGDNLPAVSLGAPVVSVSIGASDTCALLNNGSLKCWGDNFYGQLGYGRWDNIGDQPNEMGSSLPALDIEGGRIVTSIASGGAFRVARFTSGEVAVMGRNDVSGNLGVSLCQNESGVAGICSTSYSQTITGYLRSPGQRLADVFSLVDLGSTASVAEVVAGNTHVCVRQADKAVRCWGDNARGQLGIGSTDNKGAGSNDMGSNLVETVLSSTQKARTLSSGSFHVCAILEDDSVKCWGDNRFGQLGLGDATNRGDSPNQMSDNLPIVPAL